MGVDDCRSSRCGLCRTEEARLIGDFHWGRIEEILRSLFLGNLHFGDKND